MQNNIETKREPLASELFVRGQATYRLENWYQVRRADLAQKIVFLSLHPRACAQLISLQDIESLTFKTTVLPLSFEEVQELILARRLLFNSGYVYAG